MQSLRLPATIAEMEVGNQNDGVARVGGNPFRPGVMVLVTLGNPREKFWGAILSLTAEGLSLCGVELASFDDLVSLVKDGEPFSPGVVFLPCIAWSAWNSICPTAAFPRSRSASPPKPASNPS